MKEVFSRNGGTSMKKQRKRILEKIYNSKQMRVRSIYSLNTFDSLFLVRKELRLWMKKEKI